MENEARGTGSVATSAGIGKLSRWARHVAIEARHPTYQQKGAHCGPPKMRQEGRTEP
jgi:hypothetical protein